MTRRAFLAGGCQLLAATMLPNVALAQAQPRIVVGFAAGGPGDMLARLAADQLKKPLGATVIVDNRPGAAGRIAIAAAKSAEPDGTTMLSSPAAMLTMLPHAFKGGSFNPLQDLAPVATLSEVDFVVVVGSQVPARTLGEYLVLCRKDPKMASYGTAGAGTPQHMLGTLLSSAADVQLSHVPYRGGTPALQDVISGTLPACIGTLSDLMVASRKEGRIRILATSGTRRSAFLPDVPTIAEAGIKKVTATDWSGLLVPVKTPAAVVERLSRLVLDVANSADFKTALNRFYMEPLALDHKAYAQRLQAEYSAWGPVVRASGFTLDS